MHGSSGTDVSTRSSATRSTHGNHNHNKGQPAAAPLRSFSRKHPLSMSVLSAGEQAIKEHTAIKEDARVKGHLHWARDSAHLQSAITAAQRGVKVSVRHECYMSIRARHPAFTEIQLSAINIDLPAAPNANAAELALLSCAIDYQYAIMCDLNRAEYYVQETNKALLIISATISLRHTLNLDDGNTLDLLPNGGRLLLTHLQFIGARLGEPKRFKHPDEHHVLQRNGSIAQTPVFKSSAASV